jgi:dsRNA-specific ribonuclease
MKKYKFILSFLLSLFTFLSATQAMESSIFEDPEFMKSPFRASALQPRTKPFERLEFLGDRVLGLVAAYMLYKDPYIKERDIGEIALSYAFLVSKSMLVKMYKDLHIEPSQLSSLYYCAPENGHIAEKTASDVVEALMGALYIEKGLEQIQEPLEQFIEKYCSLMNEKPSKRFQKAPVLSLSLIEMYFPSSKNFTPLQEALEYQFKNVSLLRDAFHHPSKGGEAYKKLGFLGVRVLGLVIADHVFNKEHEDVTGTLAQNFDRMISNKNLEQLFQKWFLARYLDRQCETIKTVRKKGGKGTGISTGMAADTIRTLVSAVYLDGGWKPACLVVHKLFFSDPPSQFLEADPYATIKAGVKMEGFFIDRSEEIKEEAFGDFSSEECLKLPEEFDVEECFNPSDQKDQWSTFANNEEIISKKDSVWNEINKSSVKTTMEQSKNSQDLPQSSMDRIKRKTPTPYRSGVAHRLSLMRDKTQYGKNINESVIKKPAVSIKNVQSSQQLIMDKNEHTMPSPQQEMWPILAHVDQPIESRDSMWNNIDVSSIKKPAIQADNVQTPQRQLIDKNEQIMPLPQRETWPALVQVNQPIESKGSMWNINDSAIKKPAIKTENVQNSPQLLMDKNEETRSSPQREMWPALSHSTQTIGKK